MKIRDPRWTKSQLEPTYLGPYEVVERHGNSYKLVDSERKLLSKLVPIDQIKIIDFPLKLPIAETLSEQVPISSSEVSAALPDVAEPTASSTPAALSDSKSSESTSTLRRSSRNKKSKKSTQTSARRVLPDSYIVQEILAHRENKSSGNHYLVRWQGYSPKDDTWEPADHIPAHLLDQYHSDLATCLPIVKKFRNRRRR